MALTKKINNFVSQLFDFYSQHAYKIKRPYNQFKRPILEEIYPLT